LSAWDFQKKKNEIVHSILLWNQLKNNNNTVLWILAVCPRLPDEETIISLEYENHDRELELNARQTDWIAIATI